MAACAICGNDPWKRYFDGDTNDEEIFAPCVHERAAREIEEAAGLKKVHVEKRPLGDGWVDAFCFTLRGKLENKLCMAIHENLPEIHVRAREVEAYGISRFIPERLWIRLGARMFSQGMWLSKAEETRHVHPVTILAVSAVVADMEPEWVEKIRDARRFIDDEKTMAAWCELPLQIVMGTLARLKAEETAVA